MVANYYDISVVKAARKEEVRDVIYTELIKRGVLIEEQNPEREGKETEESSGDEEHVPSSDPVLSSLSGLGTEDLKLAIKLKQLDLEIKHQEHITQPLRFRQCDLEMQAGHQPPGESKTAPAVVPIGQVLHHTSDSSLPMPSANSSHFNVCKQMFHHLGMQRWICI